MNKREYIYMEHGQKDKKEASASEETSIDLGFQNLINTAIAQINNNNNNE